DFWWQLRIHCCLAPKQIYCYQFQSGQLDIFSNEEGILRSSVFPGLWIDVEALFKMNYSKSMLVLNQGLSTAEHASFVEQLKGQLKQ
ncbi:MAG: hypothetical protein K2X81_26900, partial [Candidatus Obscuribacterales bacterium]|nr:hypothetical protein [Candidatus Obscuribacterales bacterium]